jgi:hypothetical protein
MAHVTKKSSLVLATIGLAGLLSAGIAAAQADTGRHGDDIPAPISSSSTTAPGTVVGTDDPATHELGDDHTTDPATPTPTAPDVATDDRDADSLADDNGVDDPATHEVGDDHAAAPAAPAVPATPATPAHEVGDDHGIDDPATHDVGDDHGTDDHGTVTSGSGNSGSENSGHDNSGHGNSGSDNSGHGNSGHDSAEHGNNG